MPRHSYSQGVANVINIMKIKFQLCKSVAHFSLPMVFKLNLESCAYMSVNISSLCVNFVIHSSTRLGIDH